MEQLLAQTRLSLPASIVGSWLYVAILWPIGSHAPLLCWLLLVLLASGIHRFRLSRAELLRSSDPFRSLLPITALLGGLWGTVPLIADVYDFDSARGSLVAVVSATVVTNAIVAFAASRQVFAAFAIPTMLGTSVTYLVLAPRSLALVVPLGCLLILLTSIGYNRAAHAHLVGAISGRIALAEVARRHRHEARHDPLTGLWNRAGMADAFASDPDVAWIALYLDLNDFKRINDELTHRIGDLVLCSVADRLLATAPDDCIVARIGGDEFVVLVPGTPATDITGLAERITDAMSRTMEVDGNRIHIGASLGAAIADGCDSLDAVLHRADTAMYTAKYAGNRTLASAQRPHRSMVRD